MTYLKMTRGDKRTMSITATQDLEDLDVLFTAKRRLRDSDAEAIISKSTITGGIVLGVPTTKALVAIEPADTQDLGACVLLWDIQVMDENGDPHTVADGRLHITADVTRTNPGS